jgi:hypothetical protein
MDWIDLIKARETCFNWDYSKTISKEVVREVCQEVYDHLPTKNLKFPFQIDIFDNTKDADIRKEIMTIFHRNQDMDMHKDKGNPQVLAPLLIAFSMRDVSDLEVIFQKETLRTYDEVVFTNNIEIGIVSTYFMLSFANRGIATGLSQNCHDGPRVAELIGANMPTILLMGVGYKSNSLTYHDPRTDNPKKPIPFPPSAVEVVYGKPDFDDIFKIRMI